MCRRLLLLLLLPLISIAQTVQPSTDDSAAQPPGSVEGRVTNAETGEGISGASIRLIPMRRRSVSTGSERSASSQANGSFIVDAVPPGTYLVVVTQSSFGPGPNGAQSRPTVDVEPGEAVSNINIQLNPVGRIRGKVVDDEGKPIPRAYVRAFLSYTSRGKTQFRGTEVVTDKSGNYTVQTQQAGRYYISAGIDGNTRQPKSEDETASQEDSGLEFVRTFYPKSLNIENATPVDVSPGQDAPDVTIQLVRAPTYHIRGKIEGLDTDARRQTINLEPRDSLAVDGLGTLTRVEKDGTFDIPKVIAGSYTLSVIGREESTGSGGSKGSLPRLLARQDVDVGGDDVNGIVLTLIPLITLSGHVTVDGLDNTDLSQIHVNLIPSGAIGGLQTVSVQRDGAFRIEKLAPGEYMVRVLGAPSGTYIKSVTYNRQDITTTGMDLTDGGGGEIEILLRTGSGEVDGALSTGTQISSTTVMILAPEAIAQDGSGVLVANLQPSGTFIARNVAPGRYYAYVVQRWSPLWQNPDFLRSIQNQGTVIDLPENGHLQVQLSLISTDQVEAAAIPLGLTSQ